MRVSWARKKIALKQLATQKQALTYALEMALLDRRPETDAEKYVYFGELRVKMKELEQAEKEVREMRSRWKMPWSFVVVWLYNWSTRDRFKMER